MTFRELITQELMSQLQIGEPTAAALVAGDIGIEDADDPLPAEWEAGIRKYFAEHKGHLDIGDDDKHECQPSPNGTVSRSRQAANSGGNHRC